MDIRQEIRKLVPAGALGLFGIERTSAEPLGDGDRAQRLQRLDGDGEPVRERDGDVEQGGGEKDGGRRQAVLDDERDRDRHEDAEVGDRANDATHNVLLSYWQLRR